MQTRTKYEERILREMYGLSEREQAKLYRVFHFIRQEFANSESAEKQMTDEFLSVCGTWEDNRSMKSKYKISIQQENLRTERRKYLEISA